MSDTPLVPELRPPAELEGVVWHWIKTDRGMGEPRLWCSERGWRNPVCKWISGAEMAEAGWYYWAPCDCPHKKYECNLKALEARAAAEKKAARCETRSREQKRKADGRAAAQRRRQSIYERHLAGETYENIARSLGISRTRAGQLDADYRRELRDIKDFESDKVAPMLLGKGMSVTA